MTDRDETEKLVKRFVDVYWRQGKRKLTNEQRIEQIAEDIATNFVPRTEHEEAVASARDHRADLEQTIDDLREQVKELS